MAKILLNRINKSFDDKPVLVNFSAVIPTGQISGLMAPSGEGKTTLLRILMGLEHPDSGDIENLDPQSIRTMFQEDRLASHLDPIANLRLTRPDLSRALIQKDLESFGLQDCLHQRAGTLSGGQKRRVALLRALESTGSILILDEPFKGLDEETKKRVMEETKKRINGRTVLLVSHDPKEMTGMGVQHLLPPLKQDE